MPRIELIPEVYYQSHDPIHWEVDNLPLKAIVRRQNLINSALDNVIEQMRNAIGTQGSVSNRLNQSINADGSLKTAAVDEALHSIEEHTDTDNFVRMTKDESDKLATVSEGATDVSLKVYTDNTTYVDFDDGVIVFKPSTTVVPVIEAPNIVKFVMAFPESAAHQHHYGLEPVHVNIGDPDFKNYKVNSGATAYVTDSLRVYINGVRVYADTEIYVPGVLVDDPWTLLSYTPDEESGTFELSAALADEDKIRIDFDTALA